jgi:hypothetical protein
MIHVVAINESTAIADSTVDAWCVALTLQATHHVAPAWGTSTMHVERIAKGSAIPKGAWLLVVADTSDQEGALGYHEDQVDGLPVMYVFAKDCAKYGIAPSACASHELSEAICDPGIQKAEIVGGKAWALEVGDPVQAFTYICDGVIVQDFVTPAWFDASPPAGARLSYLGKVQKPFEVPPGGYAQYTTDLRSWHQVGAEQGPSAMVKAGHKRPEQRS